MFNLVEARTFLNFQNQDQSPVNLLRSRQCLPYLFFSLLHIAFKDSAFKEFNTLL